MQTTILPLDRLTPGHLLYAGEAAKSAKTAARSAATVLWGTGCCQEGGCNEHKHAYVGCFHNTLHVQTVAEGGMTSLFRGMGAPFATVAVYNAILFAARGQMESMLAHADGASLYTLAQALCTCKSPHPFPLVTPSKFLAVASCITQSALHCNSNHSSVFSSRLIK